MDVSEGSLTFAHTLSRGRWPVDPQTFDELLLLKRGGRVIYNGPLGEQSCAMVAYFEGIPGVEPIAQNYSESLC